jgi:hypothetical protein
VTDDIHDVLTGVPQGCHVIVVMDCDHATSVVDVSGTLDGKLVGGLKYRSFCGLKGHTAKMNLAQHDRGVWQEEQARKVKARPRFQPMMEIDNPRKGRLPTRPAMSRSSPAAFCYAAARHGQTAMELLLESEGADGVVGPRQHGVLSWSFVQALKRRQPRTEGCDCTHRDLVEAIRREMAQIKAQHLPRMDQEVLLTFSTPLSNPVTMLALQPLESPLVRNQPGDGSIPERGATSTRVAAAAPVVIPPPPPGFLNGGPPAQGASGGGTGETGLSQTVGMSGGTGTGFSADGPPSWGSPGEPRHSYRPESRGGTLPSPPPQRPPLPPPPPRATMSTGPPHQAQQQYQHRGGSHCRNEQPRGCTGSSREWSGPGYVW